MRAALIPALIVLVCTAQYTNPTTGERHTVHSNPVVIHYKGDVTGDDRVTLLDALIILRWALDGFYPEVQRPLADLNGNGRPDVGDAVICLRTASRR